MANPKWFDVDVYLANKLAQLQKAEPTAGWTAQKVADAFASAGFVGAEGAYKHFEAFGAAENLSPNAFFDAEQYFYAKAAQVNKISVSAVKEYQVAEVKDAIKKAGMNAWTHYDMYGSFEGVNPSNSFDEAAYLAAKLADLKVKNAANWPATKTVDDVKAAFKAGGFSALEHYLAYGKDEAFITADKLVVADANKVPTATATVTAGQTFTLTAVAGSPDSLSPNSSVAASKTTAGDDLIRGVTTGDLATVDSIDAGAGNDTLTANIDGSGAIAPVLANIENVKLTTDTAAATITAVGAVTTTSINLNSATGITTLTLAADAANHAAATNITLGTKLVAEDGSTAGVGNIAFAFKAASVTGAADSADLTVQGKADGGIVYVNSIENLALHSAAKAGVTAANSINLFADSAATLTIDGAKALTLTTSAGTETNLTGIDSSAMTAGLTYANTGAVAATTSFSIKTGAGADTLTLIGAGNKLVIDTGAGNDTVNLTTAAATKGSSITTGAGTDTIAITATAANFAAADLTTAAKLDAAAIKVADFAKGSDVLSFTGAAATTYLALTGTQLANIADTSVNTDLLAAVNAAAAIAGNNQAVVFAYSGNTYLYVEDAVAGLSTGDSLIKFVGVTDTLTNNVNFTIA